jgi:hypothetical protein
MTKKNPIRQATSLVKWLATALLVASLTACGSNDSGSSLATTAETKTAGSNAEKDTQLIKAAMRLPKFLEVKFSTPVTSSANTAASVLKAAKQPTGLVGGYLYPQYVWNSHRISVCWINPSGWDEREREWTK